MRKFAVERFIQENAERCKNHIIGKAKEKPRNFKKKWKRYFLWGLISKGRIGSRALGGRVFRVVPASQVRETTLQVRGSGGVGGILSLGC